MINNPFAVQTQITIVRRYKEIGITKKLKGYYLPTAEELVPRFYNGRVVYQHKSLRVGLTTLRKQPPCRLSLTINEPVLPF